VESPNPIWTVWQLADSAFPTGAFAHSWGLEAAWQAGEVAGVAALRRFLHDSLVQTGHAALPLAHAAHRDAARIEALDRLCDRFLTNPVANRASAVQGRAFLSTCVRTWPNDSLVALSNRSSGLCGHHAPLFGAALAALGIPRPTMQQLLLLGTLRGVLASAVRLGIAGSYEAQQMQHDAAPDLEAVLRQCGDFDETDLAQASPVLDLLHAAHDRLYSRLFQS
jgi:urease accessory protein